MNLVTRNTIIQDHLSLINHVNSVHKGITCKCNICDHKAAQKYNLNIHIQTIHLNQRYSCEICDYQATQAGHLSQQEKNVLSISKVFTKKPLDKKTFRQECSY